MSQSKYTKEPQLDIEIAPLTHHQLHEALLFIQDMLERSTIDFMVLGDTLKDLVSTDLPTFTGTCVQVGVTKPHMHEAGVSTLLGLLKDAHARVMKHLDDNGSMEIEYKGVPIYVDVLNKDDPLFRYPDERIYAVTEFKTPNPIKVYLERFEREGK